MPIHGNFLEGVLCFKDIQRNSTSTSIEDLEGVMHELLENGIYDQYCIEAKEGEWSLM